MKRYLFACAGIALLGVDLAHMRSEAESPAELDRKARARYEAERAEIREKFNEEWRAVMERLEHGCDLCGPGPLNCPEDWAKVSERESTTESR